MRNLIAEDTGAFGDLGFDGDHAETFVMARQTESIERLVKVVDVCALAQEQNVVTNAEFLGVLLYAWPVWAVTNEREHRVRLLGKELGENVKEESLVLLRHETTYMADKERIIGHTKPFTGFLTDSGVETELLQFDGIGNYRKIGVFAEEPSAGVFTACETLRRVKVRERTQCELHQVLGKLALAHRGMRMGDTDRRPSLFGRRQWEYAERIDVAVHDRPVFLMEKPDQFLAVAKGMLVWRDAKNAAAQRFDFLFWNASRIGIHQKIELHLAAVDMAVVVHHYGFDTTAKHFSHDLGYANRHRITVLEPGLSRHNGRYRLFLLIQERPENRLNQISNTVFKSRTSKVFMENP